MERISFADARFHEYHIQYAAVACLNIFCRWVLKVVTNEKGEAVGEVLTIIC